MIVHSRAPSLSSSRGKSVERGGRQPSRGSVCDQAQRRRRLSLLASKLECFRGSTPGARLRQSQVEPTRPRKGNDLRSPVWGASGRRWWPWLTRSKVSTEEESLHKTADSVMEEKTVEQSPPLDNGNRNQETASRTPPQRASDLGPRPPREAVGGTAVYVMLPLDTVCADGHLQHMKALEMGLHALKKVGVDGVMVDVWWGVVERHGPGKYDWTSYRKLLDLVKSNGLRVQAVMSFHTCGGNVGDGNVSIGLPPWVAEIGEKEPDIYYTDIRGERNKECISLFADEWKVLAGRTPLECYSDLMQSFKNMCKGDLGKVVTEVAVGMGPCGELRYPAYPEGEWQFPGIGEFQCYDKRALESLRKAAEDAGHPRWGYSGPHDAGTYNSKPWDTGFFTTDGSYTTDYGRFFLEWYSSQLLRHGDRVLSNANRVFGCAPEESRALITVKCAGCHWWYNTLSHPAELTAGYYNVYGRDGYRDIAALCKRHGALLNFTCVEVGYPEPSAPPGSVAMNKSG